MDNRPIGVFDSGLGGLTTVRRLHEAMPAESIVYFGDTGRVPYGARSPETITRYARQDVAFLRSFDLKAIVIACGTVSSVALDTLSAESDIPVIGVVWPACAQALRETRNGRIGVIGTSSTIRSGSYERMLLTARPELRVFTQPCPLFVPLVENGRVQRGDVVIETVVREYLSGLKEEGIDTLILGCTHYPLLRGVIASYMGPSVKLVDSGAAAADAVRTMLIPAGRGRGQTRYFVSDDPASFRQLAALFLSEEIAHPAELVDISSY